MRNLLFCFSAGLVFGAGLLLSGMTRPSKVVNFLDVTGDWDPSLAFVMVGAILVHLIAYRIVPRLKSPLLQPEFMIPTRKDFDRPLVVGAILFGIGWGLSGVCPGPALTSLPNLSPSMLTFITAMIAGMVLYHRYDRFTTTTDDS
jgi:uncharacterized membrane protein YedE/YeeE